MSRDHEAQEPRIDTSLLWALYEGRPAPREAGRPTVLRYEIEAAKLRRQLRLTRVVLALQSLLVVVLVGLRLAGV